MRLLLLQESNQHKNCTISLGWAVTIRMVPPVVRDERNCPKRVVVAFLLTVDVLFSRDSVFAWPVRTMYLICPCSYSYWYSLYSASLGQHGQCAYLPVFVLVLCVNRCTVCTVLVLLVQRFLGLVRAMTCLPVFVLVLVPVRAVLRLVSTGNAPICPCLYPCTG